MSRSKKTCLQKKFNNLQKITTVKGTKDLFGKEILSHNHVVNEFKKYCYEMSFLQISTPILEHSNIFTRSLGLSSDIVSKEMYSFIDQGDDKLVLRPEGTAAIARALITNSLEQNNNKYFYHGPMFRRERPQSGRLRQFHQVGIEYFGLASYLSDIETIILAEKFLNGLGIRESLTLEVNSLGNSESRKAYNKSLIEFLTKNMNDLSKISKERFNKNPLRILDSKDPNDQDVIKSCPDIRDFLDAESKKFLEDLMCGLDELNIKYRFNRFLVRGLDYYNHTAFEYITNENKSQNAVLAGGRYDGLVKTLGGSDLTGVGWAAGIERIVMLLKSVKSSHLRQICIFTMNDRLNIEALKIIKDFEINKFKIHFIKGGNLKKKLAKANKMESSGCLILGDDEWKSKKIIWKNFENGNQELINLDNIYNFFNNQSVFR